ncbi:MAG: hypothetical protein FWC91_14690 [Defluviitaleaceae bacterium]|nr:hypothetical protein [Defluviitaleaceae bacterium]
MKTPTPNNNQGHILIPYPLEKAKALKQYCLKKGISFEEKGVEFLDALYKKNVPKAVQEYIEESEDLTVKEP